MTNKVKAVALDVSVLLQSDKPYEVRVALCEQLGLIETMKHGEHDYVRITDDGRDVLSALLRMMIDATMHGDEPLRPT